MREPDSVLEKSVPRSPSDSQVWAQSFLLERVKVFWGRRKDDKHRVGKRALQDHGSNKVVFKSVQLSYLHLFGCTRVVDINVLCACGNDCILRGRTTSSQHYSPQEQSSVRARQSH